MKLNAIHVPYRNEFYATFVACLGALLCGVDMTYSADLIGQIRDMKITIHEQSLLGSINMYASAVGSLVITYFLNILGRKNSLVFILIFYFIAWVLMCFCSYTMMVIYISRAFSGFAAGMKVPYFLYITEIGHKNRRGILISFYGLSISLGITMTYIIQYFSSWYTVALVSLVLSVVALMQTYFLKETKYWLLHQNNVEKAKESMKWFDNSLTDAQIQAEIYEILSSDMKDRQINIIATLKNRTNLKCFMFGFLLYTFLFGCGRIQITALPFNYYSRFQLPIGYSDITVIQGVLELVMSVFCCLIIDKAPRKTILHICCWMMNACLVFALFHDILVNSCGLIGQWILLLALLVFYAIACGFLLCITSAIVTEVGSVTTQARGILQSVLFVWFHFISGVYNEIFPYVMIAVSINYVVLFFLINIALLSFTGYFVPETRGVALHHCSAKEQSNIANEETKSPSESI